MSFNKDYLDKLPKKDLIDIILKNKGIDDKYDNLLKEIGSINKRFEALESQLKISENLNTLKSRL